MRWEGACSMHGRNYKGIENFGWKILRGKSNLRVKGMGGQIILRQKQM
jgi:hypothetical protein